MVRLWVHALHLSPDMHAPNQVPRAFFQAFPSPAYDSDYATKNGMGTAADATFGNMTSELRLLQTATGPMWNNSIVIVASDNGGPSGQTFDWSANVRAPLLATAPLPQPLCYSIPVFPLNCGVCGVQNWPLRGGETSFTRIF